MESSTKILRALLDERGVEYRWDDGTATWYVDGVMFNAWGYDSERLTMSVCYLTPEQAIDATLGPGTCRDVGRYAFVCSECGWASDEPHHVLGGFWPKYCPECGRAVVE